MPHLYECAVRSVREYCSPLFAGTCPTDLDPIFKLYILWKQALYMYSGTECDRYEFFKSSNLHHRFNVLCLSLFHQADHQNGPVSVNSFVNKSETSELGLKSNSGFNFQISRSRVDLTCISKIFLRNCITLNSLHSDITEISSLNSFNFKINAYGLDWPILLEPELLNKHSLNDISCVTTRFVLRVCEYSHTVLCT